MQIKYNYIHVQKEIPKKLWQVLAKCIKFLENILLTWYLQPCPRGITKQEASRGFLCCWKQRTANSNLLGITNRFHLGEYGTVCPRNWYNFGLSIWYYRCGTQRITFNIADCKIKYPNSWLYKTLFLKDNVLGWDHLVCWGRLFALSWRRDCTSSSQKFQKVVHQSQVVGCPEPSHWTGSFEHSVEIKRERSGWMLKVCTD